MSKQEIHEIAESIRSELKENSDYIYDYPELGFQEYKSSQAHVDLLKKHNFEVEYPYLGFETAFRATYQSELDGPTIAYLSEYDALPGVGHGCGHNMLGTTNSGAAIVLSKIIDEIGGRVIVLGTPAEETSGVKVDMAAADTFDDIDIALCTHPSDENTMSGTSMALEPIAFEFHGKNAHAAAAPFEGVNALDAAINTFNNVNSLRQQIRPEARVHGVIKNGGEAANVIPDFTRAEFYVRAMDMPYLLELKEKVINCAKAGALAAGCTMEYERFEKPYANMVTNETLSAVYNNNAAEIGIEMVPEGDDVVGSIDMGNVSQVVPAINPYYSITNGVSMSGHTPEFRDCTKTEAGYQGMMDTVEILAKTGYDLLTDADLLQAIQDEFQTNVIENK